MSFQIYKCVFFSMENQAAVNFRQRRRQVSVLALSVSRILGDFALQTLLGCLVVLH